MTDLARDPRSPREHFQLADRWLTQIESVLDADDHAIPAPLTDEETRLAIDTMARLAQAHATLAGGIR